MHFKIIINDVQLKYFKCNGFTFKVDLVPHLKKKKYKTLTIIFNEDFHSTFWEYHDLVNSHGNPMEVTFSDHLMV